MIPRRLRPGGSTCGGLCAETLWAGRPASGLPVSRQLARSGAMASGHLSSSIIPQRAQRRLCATRKELRAHTPLLTPTTLMNQFVTALDGGGEGDRRSGESNFLTRLAAHPWNVHLSMQARLHPGLLGSQTFLGGPSFHATYHTTRKPTWDSRRHGVSPGNCQAAQ